MTNDPIKCFIECLIPITACNIHCHYCYVAQRMNRSMKKASLKYSPQVMAHALRKERLGGAAYISICGAGETLLQKEMPEIMYELLKQGHYLNVTTNGTITAAFKKIAQLIPNDLLRRVNFSFSYHYLELQRTNQLQRFFENIKYVRSLGCSFVVQLNLCDEYIDCFDEIKKTCIDNVGALPQLAATRDEINLHKDIRLFTKKTKEEYMQLGESFDSSLFRFTMKNFMVKRKEFCYAGQWAYVLNLSTGIMKPCYASHIKQNIFENVDEPIKLTAVGCHCRSPFCMNSSHFMSMGVIPSVDAPSYGGLRNRACADGTEWYNDTMKEVLYEKISNHRSHEIDKRAVRTQYIKDSLVSGFVNIIPYSIKNKLKHLLKKNK